MPIFRLGSICEKIGSGATPRGGKEAYCISGIALVRSQNVLDFDFSCDGLAYINETQASKLSNVEVQEKDVLLNITGDSVARACMMDSDFLPARVNQHVAIVRGKKDVVLNNFLLYFLQWRKKYLLQLASAGATRNALTKGMIEKLEIDLPPLEEQERIVTVLDSLQKKIEMNQRINDNLEQQARTLFRQWMLENEGNYIITSLEEIAEINPDTYSPKEAWAYINYLDTSNITKGTISEIQYIPATEKIPSRARRKVLPNDIVYSTVRPNQHHYGIIASPSENMLVSTGFAVIRSKSPSVCNELIYLTITENEAVEKLQQIAEQSTSTFPAIKPSDLGSYLIPCPIENAAFGLSKQLKAIYFFIAANNEQNKSLASIRNALLPKLMSGEINVSFINFGAQN